MANLHRYYIPGAYIFITCVTNNRDKHLESNLDVRIFFDTLERVKDIYPFNLFAYVLLPDHFHWIMRTEDPDGNFSKPMHSIKRNFTINYKKQHKIFGSTRIWQERFWDHVIRNEQDLEHHFDYIHWNPVKHGYVTNPYEWDNSSYRFWYEKGQYESDWGVIKPPESILHLDLE